MALKSAGMYIRVSPAEKVAWQTAAQGRGLSTWLRELANRASSQGGESVERPASEAGVTEGSSPSPGTKVRIVKSGAISICPRAHFHRPGVYCKSCGK